MPLTRRTAKNATNARVKRSGPAGSERGLIAELLHALRASREKLPAIAKEAGIRLVDLQGFEKQVKPLSLKNADLLSRYLGLRLQPYTMVVPAKAIALHKKGKTNLQVALALGISRRTVIRYRQQSAT